MYFQIFWHYFDLITYLKEKMSEMHFSTFLDENLPVSVRRIKIGKCPRERKLFLWKMDLANEICTLLLSLAARLSFSFKR